MSRGPGEFQLRVLSWLKRTAGATTLESLRWQFAEEDGVAGDLPKSAAFALDRAVKSLAERKLVVVEKRKLATIQEWLTHYPGKAYRRDVRQVRLDLLPVLTDWVRSAEGPGPMYSPYENEKFYARGGGDSVFTKRLLQDRGAQLAPRWKTLEPQIRRLVANNSSDNLIFLLAHGKSIFGGAPIETNLSLGQLIERCAGEEILPPELLAELRRLRNDYISPEMVGALELKSVIYRFITPVIHRHPEMKPEALDALYSARPEYLEAQPGFKPPAQPPINPRGLWIGEQYRWDGCFENRSALSRLIDQTTFQNFHFLSLR